ncbi:MAG TPA: ribonuclease HII [Methanocella sp.]|nr:ribonuclease HII [Methanocella sp.]
MIAGIDEAGRGPVIGPMVVCGVSVSEKKHRKIKSMGLKDSKLLTPKKREEFAVKIKEVCEYELVVVSPERIDSRADDETNLNELEVECFSNILRALRPAVAYVDACDVNAERFGINVKKGLDFELDIVSRHNADRDYPVVSAASILAKVHRDALVQEICESIGEDVGSGYSHDPITREFLRGYYKKNKCMPPFVRKSWKTTTAIINDCLQARLFQFD